MVRLYTYFNSFKYLKGGLNILEVHVHVSFNLKSFYFTVYLSILKL